MGESPIRQGSFQPVAVGTVNRRLIEELSDVKGSLRNSAIKQAVTSSERRADLEKGNVEADCPESGGRPLSLEKGNDE